ncbi:topoisomerase DNA-binding C4 zinc finger domain-containing protein [Jhaorihella thermophila]
MPPPRPAPQPPRTSRVATPTPPRQTATSGRPTCPRCGASMVRRIARRGPNAGGQFWGCSRYPRCKGTRNI